MSTRPWLLLLSLAIIPVAANAGVGPGARIFVAKCYGEQRTAKEFRQMAEAGFTLVMRDTDVFDATDNAGSLAYMPTYFRLAADVGLDAGVWQGGLVQAKGRGEPRINPDGKPSPYLPGNSPAAWQAMGDTLVAWAKLSLKNPNFTLVALDFEYYLGGGSGFDASFDEGNFAAFMNTMNRCDPTPAPEERYEYLKKSRLLDNYVAWQKGQVLREVRKVRARIDAVNPRFQIGVYGWGELFPAVIEGFATKAAPVVDLNAMTYGRGPYSAVADRETGSGYGFVKNCPDREGLKWSLCLTQELARKAKDERKYPFVFLSGHWAQATGPDDGSQYKFTVRQAFNSAAYADGYWIWTDSFTPDPWKSIGEWIDAMMAYFREANAALNARDYTWSNRQPDSIPVSKGTKPLSILTAAGDAVSVWNPISGERTGIEKASAGMEQEQARLGGNKVVIAGRTARLIDARTGKALMRFLAGQGLRAVAVGDVDGLEGDEVVTLNAGWVKVWDPKSGAELVRFRVGTDQTVLKLRENY